MCVCCMCCVDVKGERDSAVSVNGSHHMSEEALGLFALPSPDIPTHTLDHCKYPLVQTKVVCLFTHTHTHCRDAAGE